MNGNKFLIMMTKVGFMDESKRNSGRSPGLHLSDKQARVFSLCGPILCHLPVGKAAFCWKELARLIQLRMVGFIREDKFYENVPVTVGLLAALSVVLRTRTVAIGNRVLIEFSYVLDYSTGKLRWFERKVFLASERSGSRHNWLWAAAGLQKLTVDVAPEPDNNQICDVPAATTIVVIVYHSLIAFVCLFVTSCRTFLLVARLLMNWRSFLSCVFDFLDCL
jgi:hypothetical protein